MRRSPFLAVAAALALAAPAAAQARDHAPPAPGQATLLARAVLPARTFAPGPPSGTLLGPGPINGVPVPFEGQPVQGFSATLPAGHGRYWVMPDNGYGAIENSADFDLRVYLIEPKLETARGGPGTIAVKDFFELRDPGHKIPFAIVNDFTRDRVLTGADFDIESLQRDRDGSLWFGDEFGPFLLHTTADGRVLHAPYPLPDPEQTTPPTPEIRAPQNPFSEESSTLRVMNAMRADAQAHGDTKTPVVSPDANLLDDGDPATFDPFRHDPPAGSGLPKASSEIINVASLHTAGFKVVPYTVDDPARMKALIDLGVDGLISDRPDLVQRVAAADPKTPADFDVQAHRGGRDLRPENTLPSMEVGLDNLVTTLETDIHLTKDGIPILSHDPYIDTGKCRNADGTPYTFDDEVLIEDLTLAQIQARFICDGVIRTGTPQTNDRALSPVAVAFAQQHGLPDAYTEPTVQELFDFVDFYAAYYTTGPGQNDPGAGARAANAAKVKFDIETKLNPRSDDDPHGVPFKDRTPDPTTIARTLGNAIEDNHLEDRADVQSFDWRTLRVVVREFPKLLTVELFGDFPVFADPTVEGSDDGTNLQGEDGEANTRWLAGLPWPYRHTKDENPFRAQTSGGFEGMALGRDRRALLPMLEKPLVGAPQDRTQIFSFDLRTHRYTADRWFYPYEPRGVSIGDFQLDRNGRDGLVIERDNSQGELNGFKALEEIRLGAPGTTVAKREAADLLDVADPAGISLPAQPGDVGLGNPFAFPFNTIEDLVLLGGRKVVMLDDNNFPFSVGRHVGSGAPDDEELIVLRLARTVGSGGGS
jgi:glycerophosphoryl diester phosphodiesterase